ncbi:hypothetical protein A2Y83_01925 [Candidatus Falkowbacteria bacterium RBG_13_39_14]|uniref:Helicase Snf2 n=1 Tax=Candidatus Falkowbacteria bacterium RBG_13_39_14 TaxID=1797985 RepID=A0A1F5S0V5_9BACT|nr:MAG: hypothetical protein A2Y83_01925 [Candidatus Falkowbacteria bacterium RBG_13_39_14]
MDYDEWQIKLRRQFARDQKYKIKNIGDHPVYSDFELLNPSNGKIYKVAIRSKDIGLNYCSCPDFAINTLGTCKHIEYLLHKMKKQKGAAKLFDNPPERKYSSIFLKYDKKRQVALRIGSFRKKEFEKLAKDYFDENQVLREKSFGNIEKFIEAALKIDKNFRCYKDAIDYIIEIKDEQKRKEKIEILFPKGISSPELDNLLKTNLYQYQKEAIIFAAKAGRCVIADDMGLGKTIQAIAVSEIMAKAFGVEKVLIVCPTSLKYQWKKEIEKFTSREAMVIEGMSPKRREQYLGNEFFKITTYNVVKNDLKYLNDFAPDLIIIDEAQRIKNWKTKIAQAVKALSSSYALVLTGTPLENRLEELHSITEFIDRHKLGPLFRFLANHQVMDENGKVIGYKDLRDIKKTLSSILIRRTKQEVLSELPKRIDKNYFVDVTEEQMNIHDEHYSRVTRLVTKWRKVKFLSEKERQMLMIHLNCMRMASDSTYILDQKTRFDTKIAELMELLTDIFTSGEKVVIFSQWERMTRLVAEELRNKKINFEYLHGGVASKDRKNLLLNFHEDPSSLVFLSTDAGGVGLNLQCASTVVNLDCPWNPAVLEQRIGRVYRLGQTKPVNIINFISKGTIEESMLATLKFKKSMFAGVLDNGEDEVFMGEDKFKQFMKTVETIAAPVGPSAETKSQEAAEQAQKQKNFSLSETETKKEQPNSGHPTGQAAQELFAAGANFLGKLSKALSEPASGQNIISSFIEKDEKTGRQSLKIPMPDDETIKKAATVLSAFLEALKK